MIKPITPKEVADKKKESLPDEVLEAFNELIAEKWDGRQSVIKYKEAVARIQGKFGAKDRLLIPMTEVVYEKRWLDVEEIYRKAGWRVETDQPGWNESYDGHFIFKKGATR